MTIVRLLRRRGRSRRPAPPLRAPTWAVTVTGDQPPPTRCSAPSPEQPQRTFLAGPLTHCRRVQPEKSEAAQRDHQWFFGQRGRSKLVTARFWLARSLGPRGRRRSATKKRGPCREEEAVPSRVASGLTRQVFGRCGSGRIRSYGTAFMKRARRWCLEVSSRSQSLLFHRARRSDDLLFSSTGFEPVFTVRHALS